MVVKEETGHGRTPMKEDANADDYKLTLIKMQMGPESIELKLSELWQAESTFLTPKSLLTHLTFLLQVNHLGHRSNIVQRSHSSLNFVGFLSVNHDFK